jgi:hypothetical protein
MDCKTYVAPKGSTGGTATGTATGAG